MELLAGSLDVEVRDFLHAGYTSAYPRSFASMGGFRLRPEGLEVVDVRGALALEAADAKIQPPGPTQQSESHAAPAPMAPASMASDAFTLAIVFFFFALLALFYYRRIRKVDKPGWRPWLLAGGPLLLGAGVMFLGFPEYRQRSLSPPWQGVRVEPYADPAAATDAIIQTLIVPALLGYPADATELAAIQREVAFPIPKDEYSPGMVYARTTYGRDGWGREFRFDPLPERRYRIASAGTDGAHGTEDDIVFVTASPVDWEWEYRVNGVFLRPIDGEYVGFVHRVDDHYFRPDAPDESRALTGSDLFDSFNFTAITRHWPREGQQVPTVADVLPREIPAQQAAGDEPLYFLRKIHTADG